jgi:dipeptidyl-peptidase-4
MLSRCLRQLSRAAFSCLLLVSGCASPAPSAPRAAASTAPRCAPAVPSSVASPEFPAELAASQGFWLGSPRRMKPTEDGRYVLFLRAPVGDAAGRAALWETDVATGQSRELVTPDAVLAGATETVSAEERARRERQRTRGGGFTSFEASGDGAVVILQLSGRLYAFSRATGKTRELPAGEDVIDPRLSPDAKWVAYVRHNDVYVIALAGGKEVAVTRGGTALRPNGLAEFMAQEEFYRRSGFWWSPDSAAILYQHSDLSRVPEWTLADPAHPERPPQLTRYPRVGAPHAVVGLAIASLRQPRGKHRQVTWDTKTYPYLISVTWPKNAPPTIEVRDRLFKQSAVLSVESRTGETRTLVTEKDSTWINMDPSVPRWLPDGSGFLWSTERNGAYELELRGRDGARRATVAPPGTGYRAVLAVDGERKLAYLAASTDPNRSELWAAPLDGSGPPRLVARRDDGSVAASFGDNARVYAYAESSTRGAPQFGIRDVEGKTIAKLPADMKVPPFVPKMELVRTGDGASVAIIRPRNFDRRRVYPVIDNAYGGPWSNVVRADAYQYFEQQWLADAVDAIVVLIDARGTPLRDRAWQRAFYRHYGDVPVEGHSRAIAALARRYREMDPDRVGIYGWSNGGYVAAMATLRRPDVFKVAVSGAPVADLRDYDAIMEPFFGPLTGPDWDEASLLTWAARPPTRERPARPLLLIHGTADDNVYFAHALKFAAAMGLAGRPLELMPLVDQTHMVSAPNAASAVSLRMAAHFRTHLHGPPCAP